MKLWRATLALAAMLPGALVASDALAARGSSRAGGHGGGHSGSHAAHSSMHFSGRFVAPARFVPRTVFFAAPVSYFPPTYYAPPPVYYDPPSYYEPTQAPVYYEQPAQSSQPPSGSGPPPPPPGYFRPSSYEPTEPSMPPRTSDALASDNGPAQAPIYLCTDSSGGITLTNQKKYMVGKDCRARTGQDSPASRDYRYYCPDTRKYYPETNECASAWLRVIPDAVASRR